MAPTGKEESLVPPRMTPGRLPAFEVNSQAPGGPAGRSYALLTGWTNVYPGIFLLSQPCTPILALGSNRLIPIGLDESVSRYARHGHLMGHAVVVAENRAFVQPQPGLERPQKPVEPAELLRGDS